MAFTGDFASRCSAADRVIWLAVCSNPRCQWAHLASSQISARLYAHAHNFALEEHWAHQVYIVNIPAEMPPAHTSHSDAPQSLAVAVWRRRLIAPRDGETLAEPIA